MDDFDDNPGIQLSPPSEEELLYKELIGFYQACPDSNGIYNDTSLSDSFKRIIDSLVSQGHKNYESFKYDPRRVANGAFYTDYQTIKMKMLAVIQRMATEFSLGDANYAIYHDTPKARTLIHTENKLQNTQSQFQHQEQTQSLDQLIENATKQISESYGDEQAKEANKHLETLKTDKKWETVKNVAVWTANLGKEAFIATVPAIMKAILKQ